MIKNSDNLRSWKTWNSILPNLL